MSRRVPKAAIGGDHCPAKPENLKRKASDISQVHEILSSDESELNLITKVADCKLLRHAKSPLVKIDRASKSAASSSKGSLQGLVGETVEDLYEDSRLQQYHPSLAKTVQNLAVYIMPMASVPEDVRLSVKRILHGAWQPDKRCTENISRLLGLTTFMNLRSGRKMTKPRSSIEVSVNDSWLIWEVQKLDDDENPIVGALVLRRQAGGSVIEYLTAHRERGGKGFPMVQAAEVICEKEGLSVLWSAVDLSQDGRHFGVTSAEDAHRRWGFQSSTAKEWEDMGLETYDEKDCSVRYMKKILLQPAKSTTNHLKAGRPISLIKGVQVMKVRGQWVATSAEQTKAVKTQLPEKK